MSEQKKPDPAEGKWAPKNAKDVADRFGDEAAARWFAATTAQRKGLVSYLLTHGGIPEANPALEAEQEAEKNDGLPPDLTLTDDMKRRLIAVFAQALTEARSAEETAKTPFRVANDEKAKELERKQHDYQMDILAYAVRIKATPEEAKDPREKLARRTLQVAMIDALLDDTLEFTAVRDALANDEDLAIWDEEDLAYEYVRYVDLMIARKQIEPVPPAAR